MESFEGNEVIEFIEGDIRNYETCVSALINVDYVSHQAALGSVPRSIVNPILTNEVNISGFLNMLVAVQNQSTVKKMVYAASSSTYGDNETLPKIEGKEGKPISPYAVTKLVNELYAEVFSKVYGLNTIGLRYFNIFGPRQNPDGPYAAVIPLFVKGIINKTPVYINGDGEQTRDFTFVENAVQINVKGMLTDNAVAFGKTYNVAIGERFTVNQLYKICQQQLKSDFAATYRELRVGDIRDSLADISLAKDLLGYQPTKKFEDGLIETIKYFKNLYS